MSDQGNEASPIKNNPSSSVLPPKLENCVAQLQEAYPDCDPDYIRKCLLQEKENHLDNVANILADGDYPQIDSKSRQVVSTGANNDDDYGVRKLGWNLFNKVTKSISDYTNNSNNSTTKPLPSSSKPIESSTNMEPVTVTPKTTRDLRNVLQDAIKTCRSNSGSVIDSQASVKIVSESQTSYCDVIPGHSLHFVGNLKGIELYVPKGQSET
ncbi:9155_t:CDS:2, partial [Funneliformis mosseae]